MRLGRLREREIIRLLVKLSEDCKEQECKVCEMNGRTDSALIH